MAVEVLTALDAARTQWYHFTAIVVAGMGFFTDAYDLFVISTVTKLMGRIYYYEPSSSSSSPASATASGGGPGTLPPNVAAAVNGVALCGALAGQLFFGWLGDKLGRKKVYGLTLMCMAASSVACGLSFGSSAASVMATLCFFRFWLGFGIGGDYPLSATIMSEYASKRTRGAFIAAVFAMQGFGILAGAAAAIAAAAAFGAAFPGPAFAEDPVGSTPAEADYVWRLVFVAGAAPALLTYYWRMRMPETARYTALVAGDAARAAADMSRVLDVELKPPPPPPDDRSPLPIHHRHSQINHNNNNHCNHNNNNHCNHNNNNHCNHNNHNNNHNNHNTTNNHHNNSSNHHNTTTTKNTNNKLFSRYFLSRHGLPLLGTSSTWFLLDIAFYSQNLFQKDIFSAVGWLPPASSMSALDEVLRISRAQALIALCSTVPGYWFTVLLVDRLGRFAIQLLGFFMMTAFMLAIAIPYDYWRGQPCGGGYYCGGHHLAFVVLYALTFFFANFGPNSTTFIVPAEVFPARWRSTCHGISAAAGKAGAIVGAFGFLYAAQSPVEGHQDKGYPTGLGVRTALILLACCNGLGFFFTFLVPETKGRSLEELTGEDMENDLDPPPPPPPPESSDAAADPRSQYRNDDR